MQCVKLCSKYKVGCPNKSCSMWIDYKNDLNCTLLAVESNKEMTLNEIAKRLKLSIVRVKQIQDAALQKLSKKSTLKL